MSEKIISLLSFLLLFSSFNSKLSFDELQPQKLTFQQVEKIKIQKNYKLFSYYNGQTSQEDLLFIFTQKNKESRVYILFSVNELDKDQLAEIEKNEHSQKIKIANYGAKYNLENTNMRYNDLATVNYKTKSVKGFYYILFKKLCLPENESIEIFITTTEDQKSFSEVVSDSWVSQDTKCKIYEGNFKDVKKLNYIFVDSLFEKNEILVQSNENQSFYLTKNDKIKEVSFNFKEKEEKQICVTYFSILEKEKKILLMNSAKVNLPFKSDSEKEVFYRIKFDPAYLDAFYYNQNDFITVNNKNLYLAKANEIIGIVYYSKKGETNIMNINLKLKEESKKVTTPKKKFIIQVIEKPKEIIEFYNTKELFVRINGYTFMDSYNAELQSYQTKENIPEFNENYNFTISRTQSYGSYILNFDKKLITKEFNFQFKIVEGLHNENLYLYFDGQLIKKFTKVGQKVYLKHYNEDERKYEFLYEGGVNQKTTIELFKEISYKKVIFSNYHIIEKQLLLEPTYFVFTDNVQKDIYINFYTKADENNYEEKETNVELVLYKSNHDFPFINHKIEEVKTKQLIGKNEYYNLLFLGPKELHTYYTIELVTKTNLEPNNTIFIEKYGRHKFGLSQNKSNHGIYQINYCKNIISNDSLKFGFYDESCKKIDPRGHKKDCSKFSVERYRHEPYENIEEINAGNITYGMYSHDTVLFYKYNFNKASFVYSDLPVHYFGVEKHHVRINLKDNKLELKIRPYFVVKPGADFTNFTYSNIVYKLILFDKKNDDYKNYCSVKNFYQDPNVEKLIFPLDPTENSTSSFKRIVELPKDLIKKNYVGVVYVKFGQTEIDGFYSPFYLEERTEKNNLFDSYSTYIIYFGLFLITSVIVYIKLNKKIKIKGNKDGKLMDEKSIEETELEFVI